MLLAGTPRLAPKGAAGRRDGDAHSDAVGQPPSRDGHRAPAGLDRSRQAARGANGPATQPALLFKSDAERHNFNLLIETTESDNFNLDSAHQTGQVRNKARKTKQLESLSDIFYALHLVLIP